MLNEDSDKLKKRLEAAKIDVSQLRKISECLDENAAVLAEPCDWFSIRTNSSEAVQLWEKLRNLSSETGYWPIVTGYDPSWTCKIGKDSQSQFQDALQEANEIDVDA